MSADGFVGRVVELQRLHDAAVRGACVCVSGTEGVGKTRLVAEFLRRNAAGWPSAAWIDACASPDRVDAGAGAGGLLVVDGFRGSRARATALAAMARSGTTVLVTSRESLGVPGEVAFALAPLPRAHGDNDAPAVRLFLARAAEFGVALDAASLPAVATVVRLLDGMPLALELAAARVAVLGLSTVVAELEARVDARVRRGERVVRSDLVQIVVAWAWATLRPGDAAALAACARRGAGEVAARDLGASGDAILARLVASGIVRPDAATGVLALPPRVREYALERYPSGIG